MTSILTAVWTWLAYSSAAVWGWLANSSGLIQGLFGGAGATLLWEGLLKPRREQRNLAHILAEEVSLNIQIAANQIAMFEHNPKSVPQDFRFSTRVFESVAERIGALPTRLVGDVILMYFGMDATNRLPDLFAHTLDVEDAMIAEMNPIGAFPAGPAVQVRHKALGFQIETFKGGVTKGLDRAKELLPALRRAAAPWWQLEHWTGRPFKASFEEDVRKRIADHARKMGFPVRGDEPQDGST